VPIVTAVVLVVAAIVAITKAVRCRHEFSASELASEEEQVLKRAHG
jgi:hypothetical protein